MKIIGVCLIVVSLVLGFISDKILYPSSVEPFVGIAFCLFLIGICYLILDDVLDDNEDLKKGSVPKMRNPPEPPKKKVFPEDGGSDLSSFVERPELPKDRNKAHSILEILRDNN